MTAPFIPCTPAEAVLAREGSELNRAIQHALNYHGLDSRLNTPDWQIADLIEPQVRRYLDGTTDDQVFDRMTPEERAQIGCEP